MAEVTSFPNLIGPSSALPCDCSQPLSSEELARPFVSEDLAEADDDEHAIALRELHHWPAGAIAGYSTAACGSRGRVGRPAPPALRATRARRQICSGSRRKLRPSWSCGTASSASSNSGRQPWRG